MPRINPDLMRWAREGAGLDLVEAARKLTLGARGGADAADRLEAIERGYEHPTRSLLIRMSRLYRHPLLVFYLPEPPRAAGRGQDFRTLPVEEDQTEEVVLNVLLRDVMARQAIIRAAIEEEDEPEPLAFVGSVTTDAGVEPLVERFRATLRVSLREFRAQRSADDSFRLLRGRVESSGVFVMFESNLGSHHTTLSVDRFRGFALADPIAPFIVINDQDSRAAWSFTMLHELVHIWLGYTGVSGGPPSRAVEQFCNDVASEFLLPSRELQEFGPAAGSSAAELADRISEFATARKVSRTMVAYRLHRGGYISAEQWNGLATTFRRTWLEKRERAREAARERDERGPGYYTIRRQRIGDGLLRTTGRLLAAGALTSTKAGKVLGVKPGHLSELLMAGGSLRAAS